MARKHFDKAGNGRSVGCCQRCGRTARVRAKDFDRWNCELRQGKIVALLCPECQTVMENTEAEVNHATLEYNRLADGRVVGREKRDT